MKRVHLTCGDIYLKGYENCDIVGEQISHIQKVFLEDQLIVNPNETTLDKYYKFPFEPDFNKRIRRPFIVDRLMDIKQIWPWENNSLDEIVQIASFEHFLHRTEIPHIINEAYRTLKSGGIYKFDFPDVRGIVEQYDDDYMMELLYGNHKNQYSSHEYGYTFKSIQAYFDPTKWKLEQKNTVNHDYPSTGVWATKI